MCILAFLPLVLASSLVRPSKGRLVLHYSDFPAEAADHSACSCALSIAARVLAAEPS
jgi:hypothetical protein